MIEPQDWECPGCRPARECARQGAQARYQRVRAGPVGSQKPACADALRTGTGRFRVRPVDCCRWSTLERRGGPTDNARRRDVRLRDRVAQKAMNKAGRGAAEPGKQRPGAKRARISTACAGTGPAISAQVLDRVRRAASPRKGEKFISPHAGIMVSVLMISIIKRGVSIKERRRGRARPRLSNARSAFGGNSGSGTGSSRAR